MVVIKKKTETKQNKTKNWKIKSNQILQVKPIKHVRLVGQIKYKKMLKLKGSDNYEK